jgi:hypothetical protein
MNVPAKQGETPTPETIEAVLMRGNLEDLTPQQRIEHLAAVCASLGLNPLTRPFEYLKLSGRLQLYAKRAATDQLRKLNGISVAIIAYDIDDGLLTVTARATDKTGRCDEDYGVVPFKGGASEIAANAKMKAATKAKRRVTLAFSGLGFLDESEIPGAQRNRPETISKEQIKALKNYATEVDADIPAFLDFISDRWELDIGKLADIPATHVDDAMAMLKRKADAYAAAQAALTDAGQPAATDPVAGEPAHDPATGEVANAG